VGFSQCCPGVLQAPCVAISSSVRVARGGRHCEATLYCDVCGRTAAAAFMHPSRSSHCSSHQQHCSAPETVEGLGFVFPRLGCLCLQLVCVPGDKGVQWGFSWASFVSGTFPVYIVCPCGPRHCCVLLCAAVYSQAAAVLCTCTACKYTAQCMYHLCTGWGHFAICVLGLVSFARCGRLIRPLHGTVLG
jgi:hypothetical protein